MKQRINNYDAKYKYFIFLAGVVLTAVVYADIYEWIIISADKSPVF